MRERGEREREKERDREREKERERMHRNMGKIKRGDGSRRSTDGEKIGKLTTRIKVGGKGVIGFRPVL